jgi:hypothetical protein
MWKDRGVKKCERMRRGWAYLAGQVDEQVGNQAATVTGLVGSAHGASSGCGG